MAVQHFRVVNIPETTKIRHLCARKTKGKRPFAEQTWRHHLHKQVTYTNKPIKNTNVTMPYGSLGLFPINSLVYLMPFDSLSLQPANFCVLYVPHGLIRLHVIRKISLTALLDHLYTPPHSHVKRSSEQRFLRAESNFITTGTKTIKNKCTRVNHRKNHSINPFKLSTPKRSELSNCTDHREVYTRISIAIIQPSQSLTICKSSLPTVSQRIKKSKFYEPINRNNITMGRPRGNISRQSRSVKNYTVVSNISRSSNNVSGYQGYFNSIKDLENFTYNSTTHGSDSFVSLFKRNDNLKIISVIFRKTESHGMSDELEISVAAEDILLDTDSDNSTEPIEIDSDENNQLSSTILESDIADISQSAARLNIVNAAKNLFSVVTSRPVIGSKNVSSTELNQIESQTVPINRQQEPAEKQDPGKTKRGREASEEDPSGLLQTRKSPPAKKIKKITMAPPESIIKAEEYPKQLVRLVPDLENVHLFSKAHLDILHKSIIEALKACKNPKVVYEFCNPDRGRYKFVCPNEEAKEFAMNIIPTLKNLWPNPKIKAIDCGSIPRMVRASVVFNNPPPEILDFFEDIDLKNETIDTNEWRIYNKKKIQGNKTIFFIGIDEKSVEDLKAIGNRPYFVNGRTKITIENNQTG